MKRIDKTLLLNELNLLEKGFDGITLELRSTVDNEDSIIYENNATSTVEFLQTNEEQMSDELFRDAVILKKKYMMNFI